MAEKVVVLGRGKLDGDVTIDVLVLGGPVGFDTGL